MRWTRWGLALTVALLVMAGSVAAHSPRFGDENVSIDTALEIEDTAKSWAIYSHLHEGEPRYYTFEMEEGERLLLNLIVPVGEGSGGFVPSMVFMAPGITNQGGLPSWVEVPDGYGYRVVGTSLPEEATYEPFTPSAYFDLGRTDSPAPVTGRYYVAVYSNPPQEGNFALIVGYEESFTVEELVMIPFSLYTIYLWEGQDPLLVLMPMAATLVVGLAVATYYRRRREAALNVQGALLLIGGLIIAGTATSTLVQMVLTINDSSLGSEVIVTAFLIAVPALLAYAIVRRGWTGSPTSRWDRVFLIVLALLAVFAWAGYLVGPLLVATAALLPEKVIGTRPD